MSEIELLRGNRDIVERKKNRKKQKERESEKELFRGKRDR